MPSLTLARAAAAAIPFVMATERTAGFEQFVGRWDEARHRLALADGRHAYFIGRDGSEPVGFVIVRDWAAPERVALIKRVAVSRPGQGYGRALLAQAVFGKRSCFKKKLERDDDSKKSHDALGSRPRDAKTWRKRVGVEPTRDV